MKKILIALAVLVLFGVGFMFLKPTTEEKPKEESKDKVQESLKKEEEDNVLSFSVLGDVHAETEKLERVLKDLHNIDSNMDALILNGDVVGQGLEKQYKDVNKTLEKNKKILPKQVIKNIGNHEFFDYKIEHNLKEDVNEFLKRYYDFSGESKTYHSRWIKGYNFISLGSESGNTKELGSLNADISNEQKIWLKEKLAENYKSGRPIFVFLHQNLFWNAHPWVDTYKKKEVINALSKYPEVILFYSHNHATLKSRTVYEGEKFKVVNTGAVYYSFNMKGNEVIMDKLDITEGLYLRADGNKVTIKGRDFDNKEWIFTKEYN